MLHDPLNKVCETLGVTRDALDGADILMLPENVISAESASELIDTHDSINLAKYLKAEGANCKTAFDFGAKPKIKDRRAVDLWLGVVWLTSSVAVPVFVNLLSNFLQKKYGDDSESGSPRVHINLRVQKGDQLSTLDFEGSASDFLDIVAGLKERHRRIDK